MKSDVQLLNYISEQITILEEYVEGVSEDEFLRNAILKDACLMKLLVIGEYSDKVTDDHKKRFSEVEWQLLKAARNYYAHAYGGVNWRRVWETLYQDIPKLKERIENIIAVLEKENNAKTN